MQLLVIVNTNQTPDNEKIDFITRPDCSVNLL